jgi:hypothetical protein
MTQRGDDDYQRGRVDAILEDHSTHLRKINGSIDRFADEVAKLVLAVQRLGDAADADRSTVKTTAQALKEAKEASDKVSEKHWTPFQRGLAAIAGLTGLGALAYEIFSRH